MSCINQSLGDRMIGFVGDDFKDVILSSWADAEFAGDRKDRRSAGGGFVAFTGPHTYYPLSGVSEKQTATSQSTLRRRLWRETKL